jgi:hypothetical protein
MKSKASYRLIICVSVLLLLLTPAGCAPGKDVSAPGNEFAIYLVSNVTWEDVYSLENSDLSKLKLEDIPRLSMSIKSQANQTKTIFLNKDSKPEFLSYILSRACLPVHYPQVGQAKKD